MKEKIFSFLFLLAGVFGMQAQTNYYINPALGDDENGTGAADKPWKTLNGSAGVWRNVNCVVNLAEGEYTLETQISIAANVQIVGSDKGSVSIQGLDDDTFNTEDRGTGDFPNTLCRFFDVPSSMSLTMKNLTLKNLRLGDGVAKWWGGMITVQRGAKLVLTDVDVSQAIIRAGGGAAIDCKGTLDFSRVTFSDCSATDQGAAVSLAGDAIGSFEGCVFERNTGTSTIQVYPVETTSGVCADLRFNNCYFHDNDYSKSMYAGALNIGNFYGHKLVLHITNTTFNGNKGNSAGCIFITTSATKPRVIDMLVQNCTFAYNSLSVAAHGVCYQMNAGPSNTISGDISFVNNTFYHNDRPEGGIVSATSEIYFSDMTVRFNLINNIFLVRRGLSYGPVLFYNAANHCTPTFKGNVYETVGGGTNDLTTLFQDAENGVKVGQGEDLTVDPPLPYIDGNTQVKLNGEFTSQGEYKAPYLKLAEGSVAINAGYNDGGTLVPALDVCGSPIYHDKKDAGAYEYTGVNSQENISESGDLKVFVDLAGAQIIVNKEVVKASIYNLSGIEVLNVCNTDQINISSLQIGVYLLRLEDKEGNILSVKVKR